MTAALVTEGTRTNLAHIVDPTMFDGDNGVRFRVLRRIDGLLWARVAEASSTYAFKEERNA